MATDFPRKCLQFGVGLGHPYSFCNFSNFGPCRSILAIVASKFMQGFTIPYYFCISFWQLVRCTHTRKHFELFSDNVGVGRFWSFVQPSSGSASKLAEVVLTRERLLFVTDKMSSPSGWLTTVVGQGVGWLTTAVGKGVRQVWYSAGPASHQVPVAVGQEA